MDSASIMQMNDQHAYMSIPADDPLAVGDLVGCGISHPCTSFNKRRLSLVADQHYNIVGSLRTFL